MTTFRRAPLVITGDWPPYTDPPSDTDLARLVRDWNTRVEGYRMTMTYHPDVGRYLQLVDGDTIVVRRKVADAAAIREFIYIAVACLVHHVEA